MTHRIVLDTDMGTDVDDALCLARALASPEIELVAVTHVSRDTRLRAAITRRLLELAGRPQVPVHPGCSTPLEGGETFAWFGHEGKGIIESGDVADSSIAQEDSVDALIRLFRSDPDLELVAVGPLTNVAAALRREPALAKSISRLTIMGGHIRSISYGGHVFRYGIDYNLSSDAAAAEVVLTAGIPTRLVTADVTLQVWMSEGDLQRLEATGHPFHAALGRAIRHWTPIMNKIFTHLGARMDADNVAFLHDPLALACAYDESFCTFQDLYIEPTRLDGIFRSLEHRNPIRGAYPMRCALSVDATRFQSHFMSRLTSIAAQPPTPNF
jgi:purine nucleosidase